MKGIKRSLMGIMGKMMISCEKAAFLTSKSQDTKLSIRESMALKMHIFVCKYCKLYSIEIAEINHAIQHLNLSLEKEKFNHILSDTEKKALQLVLEENSSENK